MRNIENRKKNRKSSDNIMAKEYSAEYWSTENVCCHLILYKVQK